MNPDAPASAAATAAPEDATAPRLSFRSIAVHRGERQVLDGLSLEVRAGEVFGILGPNGAGKTTFFHIVTGLLDPEAGEIALDGRPLRTRDPSFRERVGIVFQEAALDPRLTARENLALAASLYGVPRTAARVRIEDLLRRMDLGERMDEPVKTFSGGMRRKAEIARALLHDPSILVLDEPTTGLDEGAFRRTWELLLELRRDRGLTLLLTTHRPEEAERCDRIAILDRGRIVACDTLDRLRATVRGDALVLEAERPAEVAAALSAELGLAAHVLGGKVVLEQDRGHEWIPRIVEALPAGVLRSVSLRRAGLGEVFLEMTGHDIEEVENVPDDSTSSKRETKR